MNPHDKLHISKSPGPVSNTGLDNWSVSFDDLLERLSSPRVGKKDGSYFVRGPVDPDHPSRADQHIKSASLVVLDGDSTLDRETGEVRPGAPDPLMVHEVLRDLDIQHIVYSTASHQQAGKGNRYRVLVPAEVPSPEALRACVDWLVDRLHAEGLMLASVAENLRWGQPWYFPRKADAQAEFLAYHHDGGERLDVAACTAWAAARPMDEARLNQLATSTPSPPGKGAIALFNERHGADWIEQTLHVAGYAAKDKTTINGHPALRLVAPTSTTDQPGVVLFKSKGGRWLVASHHGEHDPLSAAPANDAFDLFRIFEHGGDQAKALRAWREELDPRPVIRVYGGSLPRSLREAVAALADVDPPSVYQRGQTLCRVAHLHETGDVHGCTIPKGSATIVTLQKAGLMVELGSAAKWERKKDDVWFEADPCPKVTGALLEAAGQWGRIPSLVGICESPILRADGTLHGRAGYDETTRLYVEGRFPEIKLPDRINLADAQAAARYLLRPFEEFPFVKQTLDHAALLGYLLTLAQRPTLPTAPMFGVSATTPGTGKGLLLEACNLLVRGRDAALMPAVQGNFSEEETRKRLTSLLLQGVASINLDNWTRPVGGESMNALLTASEWSDRILGRSEVATVPARVTVAATGNNLSVRGDMTRRCILIELDAEVERPERREFKQKDLPGFVLQHRADLLTALFTVMKAYQQAGLPGANDKPLGRFEAWSRAVAAPIRWLGYPCPTETQARLREQDPEAEKLEMLLTGLHDLCGTQWVTVGELIDRAETTDDFSDISRAKRNTLMEALLDVANDGRGRVNRKMLGWYLRHKKGRIAGGLRLAQRDRSGSVSKASRQYRVELAGESAGLFGGSGWAA